MAVQVINYSDFIRGEGLSDFLPTGGFSPDSYGLNLTKKRGVLYFAPSVTDRGGATLTGNIIASANDKNFLGQDKYFVDDEGAFYTFKGSTFTKRQTVVGSSADNLAFTLGNTDLIQYQGNTYCTAQYSSNNGAEVIKLSGGELSSVDGQYWTVTGGQSSLNASVRHPMVVLEDILYIADKDKIHKLDGSTITSNFFNLPSDVNVTSLCIHPNGRNILAFAGLTQDFSHTSANTGKAFYLNPVIQDWEREVDLPTQVEGCRNVGGTIYATWGNNFGVFDGATLTHLKELSTSTTTYSQNISNMEDVLILRDGLDVLAYGDLGSGRVWWRPIRNTTNSASINHVTYKGDNKLLIAFSDGAGAGKLQEIDYDNSGTNGAFMSNRFRFGQRVHINKVEIIHDQTDTSGTTTFAIHQRAEDGSINTSNSGRSGQIESFSYTNQAVVESETQADIQASIFQLYLALTADDIGFQEIRIYYDPIN